MGFDVVESQPYPGNEPAADASPATTDADAEGKGPIKSVPGGTHESEKSDPGKKTPPSSSPAPDDDPKRPRLTIVKRSEEHTSELQSLMRNSYAVVCLKKKTKRKRKTHRNKRDRKRQLSTTKTTYAH